MMIRKITIIVLLAVISCAAFSQIVIDGNSSEIDYANPKEYELGGITVSGTQYLDQNALILLSGLTVGEKITVPGDAIAKAIKNLWKQKLFADIEISATKIHNETIFLDIKVKEQRRLSRFKFNGVSKSEADDLREKINLYREKIVTENLLINTNNIVKEYFIDKGFLNTEASVLQKKDSLFANRVMLVINITKGKRVKINKIIVKGNKELSSNKIKRALKETKEKSVFKPFEKFDSLLVYSVAGIFRRDSVSPVKSATDYIGERVKIKIFKTSKFIDENFQSDKKSIAKKYSQKGFRDAIVIKDSIYRVDDKTINIILYVDEGRKYYFRNITWIGNTKHSTKELNDILGIKKGDIYNEAQLEMRLFMNPNGKDVSSVYMDDGYLFFNLVPVEILVENDSIDVEIRIQEGQQAHINRVTVVGNTKTNDHVIMREIRTKPGQLFSRSDIIRSQRELAQLGFFDPEKLGVNPKPNPADGTVDIEYEVAEHPSDQIELSGGWGGGRVVGTLGVSFSNFSTKNFFKKGAWRPLPAGDGQRLSIRAQSNGVYYHSYNISFTEPWLGGKKPNSFSITAYNSVQSNGQTKYTKQGGNFLRDSLDNKIPNDARSSITITGLSLGLGKRLTWPDDYFTLYSEINYQHYKMDKWYSFIFPTGVSNNLYYRAVFSRNSIDRPIYPFLGSQISLSTQFTFPYSLFRNDTINYKTLDLQDKYKWVEYHKTKFTASWFTRLLGNLVLNTKVGFGFLGLYNRDVGAAPFERFYLGGSGLTGYALDGREIIALRGYDDQSVSPQTGGKIISKYTMELRYPFSLNPSATIYALGFVEAGNTWDKFSEFNPYQVKRSAGFGLRIFLPMFGMLGLDWGYRFDDIPGREGMQKSQLHFTIGTNLGEL